MPIDWSTGRRIPTWWDEHPWWDGLRTLAIGLAVLAAAAFVGFTLQRAYPSLDDWLGGTPCTENPDQDKCYYERDPRPL